MRWPASSNSNPVSKWSDLLPTTVRWDHWARDFCRTASKQRAIHDRRLLARQNLVLVFDLADVEVIAQQIVQRATAERDAAARRTRRESSGFGADVALSEVP